MKPVFSRAFVVLSGAWLLLRTAMPAGAACGTANLSSITNLPTDASYTYQVYGLNATGQLTGYLYGPAEPNPHAFVYTDGSVTDLGTLGGPVSEGLAINGAGVIAGDSYLSDFQFHAFLAQSNQLVDLGTLGGTFSSPYALNDAGQVVGSSYTLGDMAVRAFLYSDGVMTNLGTLGGDYSAAFAVNGLGSVIGESTLTNGDTHAFLYANGAMVDLGTLGGSYSSAFSLNDFGTVVGQSTLTNGQTHAFLSSSNVMTDLGTLGGTSSAAFIVNRLGQVVGSSTTVYDAESHGFIYQGGAMTDLGTLGGTNGSPVAMNDLGQVVGDCKFTNGVTHPFLWEKGRIIDLNTLLPQNSGWELTNARLINNAGRIVGLGLYQGTSQWFIVDVVPGNQTPIAVAGPDQVVECGNSATLDASSSSDPDGDALTYQWSDSGTVLGATPTLTVSLPLGTNVVTLVVSDPCGASAQTNVTVIVRDTTPPTGSCPGPFTASADSTGQAAVPNVLPQVIASDNCTPSNSLNLAQSPVAGTLVGLGSHPITVTVTDASGNSSRCSVSFTVADTTPPVIKSVPGPLTVSADANCHGVVPNVLGGVLATDNCSAQVTLAQSPAAGALLGIGSYLVAVTATDDAGNSSSATVGLTIANNTPPVIQSITATPTVLSPPNGKLTPVTVSVLATGNCNSALVNKLVSITCSDPASPGDMQITGDLTALLAATKSSSGADRVYTLTVKSTDTFGNSSTGVVLVTVPHDNSGKTTISLLPNNTR